jgi:hypothetical protein
MFPATAGRIEQEIRGKHNDTTRRGNRGLGVIIVKNLLFSTDV